MNKTRLFSIILSLISSITLTSVAIAQSDVKKLDTKDLVDKVERPEIDQDTTIEIETEMAEFEIPTIDVENDVVKDTVVTKEKIKRKKTTSATKKPTRKVKTKKVVKKQTIKANNKRKLITSNRPLLLSKVKELDKIVFENSKRFILRKTKTKIIKYPYNNAIPVDSASLKVNADGSFYVINKAKFIADSKALKTNNDGHSKIVKTTKNSQELDITVSSEDRLIRNSIEEKYNYGKKIKKEIVLKNLKTNDDVYIVKGVQFVFRKKKATSGINKYWLTEKMNTENSSVRKISKNKYKIIKAYQTD